MLAGSTNLAATFTAQEASGVVGRVTLFHHSSSTEHSDGQATKIMKFTLLRTTPWAVVSKAWTQCSLLRMSNNKNAMRVQLSARQDWEVFFGLLNRRTDSSKRQ